MDPRGHPRSKTDLGDLSQSARRDYIRSSVPAVASTANLKSGAPFPPIPRLYTVPQVAEALNVSTRTVRRLIADEKLPTVRIGRAIRVREDVLMELIDEGDI
jgi:excisionase family DNA binding protein